MSSPRFRHEVKYVIDLSLASELLAALQPFCSPDAHAGTTGAYEIASVYYDSADLSFYRAREESVGYRRKVRLRTYNQDGQAKAMFLEIKEKHKQHVSKKRLFLKDHSILNEFGGSNGSMNHVDIPLARVLANLEGSSVGQSAEVRELSYLSKRLELVPVLLNRYIRTALVGNNDHDLRITLDTRITAGGKSLPLYDALKETFLVHPEKGVLEIKTNQGIPLWLHSILLRYELTQTRYSKYCLGVDALYGSQRPWLAFGSQFKAGISGEDSQRESADNLVSFEPELKVAV
jgi:SPX domain protein involved in polyphosphate accumulation